MRRTSSGSCTMYSPLSENITTMVKSSANQGKGADPRDEALVVPLLTLARTRAKRVRIPAEKGDAEIDEHALGDLGHGDVDGEAAQSEPGWEDCDEEPGIGRVEQHLEDGVEGDEPAPVLAVSFRQVIPDNDHGDAAGQADEDEAHHVLGRSRRNATARKEHQERADDPILQEREAEHPAFAETGPISSYRTRASGGYIMRMSPMAMGEGGRPGVEPVQKRHHPGESVPGPTPTAMARKIQRVR